MAGLGEESTQGSAIVYTDSLLYSILDSGSKWIRTYPYPGNTEHDVGMRSGWDIIILQGTRQKHIHTQGQFSIADPPAGMFLGG